MWTAGMTVYCASCIVANLWILMRFNQHDPLSTISLVLMFAAPFFFYILVSMLPLFKNHMIAHEFLVQLDPKVLLAYILITFFFIAAELFRNQVIQIGEKKNQGDKIVLKFETADVGDGEDDDAFKKQEEL